MYLTFGIWPGITVGLSMILSIFVVNLVETIIIKKGDEDEDSSTR